jgi:hypothetical protein
MILKTSASRHSDFCSTQQDYAGLSSPDAASQFTAYHGASGSSWDGALFDADSRLSSPALDRMVKV